MRYLVYINRGLDNYAFKRYGIFARFLANNEPCQGFVTTACNNTFWTELRSKKVIIAC
jgi:hypothetical protein